MTESSDLTEVPDFSRWATTRLRVLLEDYRNSLQGIALRHGERNNEYKLYSLWVKAIDAELRKRDAIH